ncbi:MAG: VIT family protein [Rhodobacteraceae bacterium]|nr:VIT family protein [Paracoccaceae bacterium]
MPKHGHFINRSIWLRAVVLGANDGIISTASLLVGVTAAGVGHGGVLLTGLTGLVAGALSMAAGEYVSVSAQRDTETADLARELHALEVDPEYELGELAQGLEARGVSEPLAWQVAQQMTSHDALDAHAREELGLTDTAAARPVQAAWVSALSFVIGGALPLVGAFLSPPAWAAWVLSLAALTALALLGFAGARLGGAPSSPAVARVLFWGCVAMGVTAGLGRMFGLVI